MKLIPAVILILFCLQAFSQEDEITINDLYIDFAIPDVSAFNMLGQTPLNISRPGNIKDIALQALNMANAGKNITSGIATEITPYLLLNNKTPVTSQMGRYRKSKWKGLQLTFGTLTDSSVTRVGYGVKWTFFDKADPLNSPAFQQEIIALQKQFLDELPDRAEVRNELQVEVSEFLTGVNENSENTVSFSDFIRNFFLFPGDSDYSEDAGGYSFKFKSALKFLEEGTGRNLQQEEKEKLDELFVNYYEVIALSKTFNERPDSVTFDYKIAKRLERYRKENWNRAALHAGLGHVLESEDSRWESLKGDRISYFINFKHPVYNSPDFTYGVSSVWQLTGNQYFSADSAETKGLFSLGNRIIVGHDYFRVSLENMVTLESIVNMDNYNFYRGTLGFEFQVVEGTWLELAVGLNRSFSDIKEADGLVSLMNFKYTIGKERRFK